MQIQPKKRKSRKTSSKATLPKPAELSQHPDLQDTFQASQSDQERRHLLEEHQLKLEVRDQMHRARLAQIRQQLQIQVYKLWNEMWLQRQKVSDQSFKEWLKVFSP